MDLAKVAQMVNVLNGLTARDALCLLVGCMLTVLDEAPSDEDRQQSVMTGEFDWSSLSRRLARHSLWGGVSKWRLRVLAWISTANN